MRFDGKDWADDAGFFQFCIIRADLVKKVHAGLLEPTDVIGVVDDLHLICFVILGDVDIGVQFIFQKKVPPCDKILPIRKSCPGMRQSFFLLKQC
ncbi:hypothetical protein SDC9_125136 [bioreactor metagenome]|uniref:Uncharacterized protein n=1 Tax=bioreactor metagenome TaxID=1076179 RepID=A0A645CMJ4_9ZZZZ